MSGVSSNHLATMRKQGREASIVESRARHQARPSPMTLLEPLDPIRPAQICPWSFQLLEPKVLHFV